jgi:hypothetical protein
LHVVRGVNDQFGLVVLRKKKRCSFTWWTDRVHSGCVPTYTENELVDPRVKPKCLEFRCCCIASTVTVSRRSDSRTSAVRRHTTQSREMISNYAAACGAASCAFVSAELQLAVERTRPGLAPGE